MAYFLAVVEHGGFGRAAAALGVAQPTLSQSVRALERDLGADLFHRAAGGVVLSAAGRALLGPARQLLRDVAAVRESVGTGSDGRSLDLVAAPALGHHAAVVLVGSFRAARPEVTVRLERPEAGTAVATLIRDGLGEIGLDYLTAPIPDLVEIELGDQHLLLVFPPGDAHPPGPLPLRVLAGADVVAYRRGRRPRDVVEAALRAARVSPRVVLEVSQRDAILDLVQAGVGAAFIVGASIPAALARGLSVHPIDPPLRVRYGLVHRPGSLSEPATDFLRHARGATVDPVGGE